MDAYDVSQCPICRAKHNRLPRVCTMLNSYLLRQYPVDCAARAAEMKATEAQMGMQSSEVDELLPQPVQLDCPDDGSAGIPYTPQPADFQCSNPSCGRLLLRPRVPVCGHPVCSVECLDQGAEAGETRCPLCRLPVGQPPGHCRQLGNLVASLFPEAAQQAQHVLLSAAAGQPSASPAAQRDSNTAHTQPAATRPGLSASAAEQQPEGTAAAAPQRVPEHIHYGIGCDCCGAYPIRGKRYKCMDCPEAIGFDLCGPCHELGRATFGRFNQKHTAGHRMELQQPRYHFMHQLQAANPNMTSRQLMELIRIAMAVNHSHSDTSSEDDQADTGAEAAVSQVEAREAEQDWQPDGSGGAAPEPTTITVADMDGSGWDRMAADMELEGGAMLGLTESTADQLDRELEGSGDDAAAHEDGT